MFPCYIRFNLQVAQNERFIIYPAYPRGGTMVVKILDFKLFQSLKNGLFRTFCSPKLSLGSWILHCFCKNFPEYPPNITIRTSTIVYLIPQHFSWFKHYKVLILKLVPGGSFASAKTIIAFIDVDLLLMIKMMVVTKSNART